MAPSLLTHQRHDPIKNMQVRLTQHPRRKSARSGFGIVDALFGMAIAGVMFTTLYAGLGFGFKVIKFARENTRATQIMLEKMETIRLYTWDQVTNTTFMPVGKFAVPYYAIGSTNGSLMYTGQIFIQPSGLSTSYADEMRKVTIQVDWCPLGSTNRTRTMSTYVTKNGMQTYVY